MNATRTVGSALRVAALAAMAASAPLTKAAPVADALVRPALPVAAPARATLLGVAPAGARLVAVGERGIVALSDDAGQTWRQGRVPVSVTLTAVRFIDARNGFAVGHGGVVLASTDGGETWEVLFDGLGGALIFSLSIDPFHSGVLFGAPILAAGQSVKRLVQFDRCSRQTLAIVRRRRLGKKSGRMGFQRFAKHVVAVDLLCRRNFHPRSGLRFGLHQPFALQPRYRIANRHRAHPQLFRQSPPGQRRPRRQSCFKNRRSQVLVHLGRQMRRCFLLENRHYRFHYALDSLRGYS